MPTPLLATKLYIPQPRTNIVLRPRLTERLNAGLHHKLTLISAPAGFGKTTLVSSWVASLNSELGVLSSELLQTDLTQNSKLTTQNFKVAWLSLDAGDNDPTRFLTYFVAALQTIAPHIGAGILAALQSPQPPPPEAILTALLNEITAILDTFVLVLDDYHVIDSKPIDHALAFLLEHMPPQMHLVIATREDPQLPLARLRARSQLTELRAADVRFTPDEAAAFLNQAMGLRLSAEEIAALEARTEGWIAGLQLAAISMQGQQDTSSFITSFTGSHRFVLDYLLEEVLHQQPESVQTFLLHTSILERMCGPLCDAVLCDPSASGQAMLEYVEQANLFIVPLDDERRWYRYHHLFAELLRQRLRQSVASSPLDAKRSVAALHIRASQWYEDNGLELEAFQHAAAANDTERVERLIEGKGMPLQFRGAAVPILNWLASLPTATLDAVPGLWVTYASALLMIGQVAGVEEKAQAAEAALHDSALDDKTRDLIGRIASIRATVAVTQHQIEAIIVQARRALEYLRPDNLPVRTSITWTLGYAYHLQGDRAAAKHAYAEAIAICEAIGHIHIAMMATIGLGHIQEGDNQLHLATETYRRALELIGDPPPPPACDAYLGLARIAYQWNDLDAAQQYLHKSMPLAQQIQNTDRLIGCELLLSRLKLTQGDLDGAGVTLAQAGAFARQHAFVQQIPVVAAAQVLTLLRQSNLAAAAQLAQDHNLPISRARVSLAQGDPAAALAVLEPVRQQMESKGWADEHLKVTVLQALAHYAHGETEQAVQLLHDALALAEPGGFIRLFVDEGPPMAELLRAAAARGIMPGYTGTLLAAFEDGTTEPAPSSLVEPLSQRELQILLLIAAGNKNQEIADELVISLNTVRYHTKNLYGKLGVNTRTHAVVRAQELGVI